MRLDGAAAPGPSADRCASGRSWFGKAAYPLVFIAPNNPICLFAGAAGMSLPGFFVANLAGTLARLYLIRRLGDAFDRPDRRRPGLHRRPPACRCSSSRSALAVVFAVIASCARAGPAARGARGDRRSDEAERAADRPTTGRTTPVSAPRHRRRHRRVLGHRRGHRRAPRRRGLGRGGRRPPARPPRGGGRADRRPGHCPSTSPTRRRSPRSAPQVPDVHAARQQRRRRARACEPVAEADEDDWRWMFETNVLGVARVTKALLPALDRQRRRPRRAGRLDRRARGLPGRRRLQRGQVRRARRRPGAAPGAARPAGAGDRGRPRHGRDRVLPRPLRRRRRSGPPRSTTA